MKNVKCINCRNLCRDVERNLCVAGEEVTEITVQIEKSITCDYYEDIAQSSTCEVTHSSYNFVRCLDCKHYKCDAKQGDMCCFKADDIVEISVSAEDLHDCCNFELI